MNESARRARTIAAAVTVASSFALVGSCREPTQITVTVTTDAKCTDIEGASIAVGQLGDELEKKPASATSFKCDPSTGRIGTLVIEPSGAKDGEVAFRVVAGFGKNIDSCVAPFGAGCIVARRALRFIAHTPLSVNVQLSVDCAGVPCDALTTCVQGKCVSPKIDPTQCESSPGCDLGDGGAAASDGGARDGAPALDAGDGGPPNDAAVVQIVSAGNVPAETGQAQQQHLLYATHSGRWWFFFIDDADTSVMKTLWSTDFTSWNAGASLPLADRTMNEGRDFSVAYADIAGTDVVHIVSSSHATGNPTAFHSRATINGVAITFGAESPHATTAYVPGAGIDPDGPVAAVTGAGRVYLATGWINERGVTQTFDTAGNMDVFGSTGVDNGVGGDAGAYSYVIHSWVPEFVNNRALVPIESDDLLAIWPQADIPNKTDSNDISWASSKSAFVTHDTTFNSASPTATNDWSACATSATKVHLVRRKISGGANDSFQHMIYDSTANSWTTGQPIASDPGANGSGIVMLTNGTKLLLFAISSDGASSVRMTKYDGSWSNWTTTFGTPAKRGYLSSSGCSDRTHAALVWTEGGGAPYRAVGADVSSLF